MLLTAEVLLLAGWLCLALFVPYDWCRSWRLERMFRSLAAHGPASILFVGLVAFGLAALASYLRRPGRSPVHSWRPCASASSATTLIGAKATGAARCPCSVAH